MEKFRVESFAQHLKEVAPGRAVLRQTWTSVFQCFLHIYFPVYWDLSSCAIWVFMRSLECSIVWFFFIVAWTLQCWRILKVFRVAWMLHFPKRLNVVAWTLQFFLRVWRKFESWNLNVTFSKTVDCHCMNVTLSEMFEWFCMNVSVFGGWWGLLRDVDQLAQFARFGSSSVAWNELKKLY